MKQQNIDFKEIDKDVLGTEGEHKAPPSSSSWQNIIMCALQLATCHKVYSWNRQHMPVEYKNKSNIDKQNVSDKVRDEMGVNGL